MERYYELRITCLSNEEKFKVGEKKHNALKGNPDYIENRIVLSIDTNFTVILWADYGVKIPESLSWENINKMFSEED